jgi:hypothetical protein
MMAVFLKALFPPADVGKVDTSLRYTDILFGFVIKELFLRLQNWQQLDSPIKWHLVVGTTLVLGSWVGFRRSVHRAQYEVKFFNLPFFKFIADQLMLIIYFRVAVLTDTDLKKPMPPAADLAAHTVKLVTVVFALYLAWDVLGILMAKAKDIPGWKVWKYAKVVEQKATDQPADPNWIGTVITLVCLAVSSVVSCKAESRSIGPTPLFILATATLLVYRLAKEVRTSCRT